MMYRFVSALYYLFNAFLSFFKIVPAFCWNLYHNGQSPFWVQRNNCRI